MKHFLVIFIIIWSLLTLGCPQDSAVRKAAKASFELSGITLDVINATAKAYDAGIISLATKDKMAAAEKQVASGGKHFNDLLAGYIAANPNGTIPTDKLSILNQILNSEIVTPFLAILEQLKVISSSTAGYLNAAINTLRTAILVISGIFGDAGFPQRRELAYV